MPKSSRTKILKAVKKLKQATKSAAEIKPTENKTIPDYPIENFESLDALKKHLEQCVAQKSDFHLTTPTPEKDIATFVLSTTENKHNLNFLYDGLSIFRLAKEINQIKKTDYANYINDVIQLLSVYEKKIASLLKENTIESHILIDDFFRAFHQNPEVSALRSESNSIYSFIKRIDIFFEKINRLHELSTRETSQQEYAQLLNTILEGRLSGSVFPLSREEDDDDYDTGTTLLPRTEFQPPSAEPEHPNRIGLNKTLSFTQPKKKQGIFELFSSTYLKKEFLNSFDWAADTDSLYKLKTASSLKEKNLVGTDFLLGQSIQANIINYALLSLDALAKLCGNNGSLAIQNYPAIKDITDRLKTLSDQLDLITQKNDPNLEKALSSMTAYLVSRNQLFYETQKEQQSNLKVRKVSQMNDFCHLNQRLSAKLLGVEKQPNLFLPETPSETLLKKMDDIEKQK